MAFRVEMFPLVLKVLSGDYNTGYYTPKKDC